MATKPNRGEPPKSSKVAGKTAAKPSQKKLTASTSDDPLTPIGEIELFFGLVGPTGTDLDNLSKKLSEHLTALNYSCEFISLSAQLQSTPVRNRQVMSTTAFGF